MIKQLSGQCYEWDGGSLDFDFIRDSTASFYQEQSPKIINFPAPASSGIRYSRDQIETLKNIIDPILAKYGRFELCGSYRRGKATIKDMDYIIETSQKNFRLLRNKLAEIGIEFHRGANEIMNGVFNGTPVDFFRTDPNSYISILIWRTGSARHNIYCATIARYKKMKVKRIGIEKHGNIVYPKTEHEFYEILGIPYIPPHGRDMEF